MPIARDVEVGPGARIFFPDLVNLYGCAIGAESQIGPFVEIQREVIIGLRCKIASHTFICTGVITNNTTGCTNPYDISVRKNRFNVPVAYLKMSEWVEENLPDFVQGWLIF